MTRIQFRRGNSSDWVAANPPLLAGEFGFELDSNRAKIGNGDDPWNDLPYFGETTTILPPVGSYTYSDGKVVVGPYGEVYDYNVDGTVHTVTYSGVTRTFSYNGDGTIASVT